MYTTQGRADGQLMNGTEAFKHKSSWLRAGLGLQAEPEGTGRSGPG